MASREDAALIPVETITHWMHLPELPKERHNHWSRELLLRGAVTVESRLGAAPVEYTGKADDKLQDSVGLDLPKILGILEGKKWEVKNQAKVCGMWYFRKIL